MLNQVPKFPELEQEILAKWEKNKIFKKTLDKESPKGQFVFYEGPPTANGKPGLHHVLSRSFKDIICRYKTMQGFHVPRKAGWDTHGLPVELQVEKALGISGKPEIEKYGIKEFNAKCKESVWLFKDEWEKLTKRMGFWLDTDDAYITYSNDFIESVWWVIKSINDKGLIYLGHKVVHHCPRCGTALSSHEVAQGYKEVTDETVYVKFELVDQPNTFILAWTTTPWTLPGNLALAISDKIEYAKVEFEEQNYIIASDLVEKVFTEKEYKVIEKLAGSELVGLKYKSLYPGAIPEAGQESFVVTAGDFVTTVDGTGVVHIAPMYGEDDYQIGEKLGLPKVHTVDENGIFKNTVKFLAGRFAKDPEVAIEFIKDLKIRGLLFKKEKYKHEYPHCWRCDTPLLYYAKNSWFIKMSDLREQMVERNQGINWVPDNIKEGRFGEWLANAKDWAISRERYWGTPLPIWVCSTDKNHIEVIGSYAELARRRQGSGGQAETLPKDFDPHKPFIDEYHWKCEKCDGQMNRVKMVADVWLDSGSMPWAQLHYPFENQELIDKNQLFPADYIVEAIDQTRGWFYTLVATATALGYPAPYKNVICLGHINDKDGKKMSKSKGNIVVAQEIFDKYGADAVRYHFLTMNQAGETKNFNEQDVLDVVRKNFVILWNVLLFYQTYATEKHPHFISEPKNVLDRWILSKLNILIEEVTADYDQYDLVKGTRLIGEFINELSTWYLRRSRDRFKSNDETDKAEVISTMYHSLIVLSNLMAPSTPFIAEELYSQLNGPLESVHLVDWPKPENFLKDQDVLGYMDLARQTIEKLLAKRAEVGIKIRQKLNKAMISVQLPEEYLKIIAEEVNVNLVEIVKGEKDVDLDTEMTEELILDGLMRELTRSINAERKNMKLTPADLVTVTYKTDSEKIQKMIEQMGAELAACVKATKIEVGDGTLELDLNGEKIAISIMK